MPRSGLRISSQGDALETARRTCVTHMVLLIGSRSWRLVWQAAIVSGMKRQDRQHLRAVAHPTRRDGAIAAALLVLPWVVALVLVRRHYPLDGGTVGILVAVSLGLSTLWVTWATYRGPRRANASASGLSLAQVADQLAIAVGAQWNAEALSAPS